MGEVNVKEVLVNSGGDYVKDTLLKRGGCNAKGAMPNSG